MTQAKRARRNLLNGVPQKVWPDAVIHHGIRLLVLLGLAVGATLLFPSGPGVNVGQYQMGVVADRDLIALVDFPVRKNASVLALEQQAAVDRVPATFLFRPGVADSVRAELSHFFGRIDSAAVAGGTAGVTGVLSQSGIDASAEQTQLLSGPGQVDRLRRAANNAAATYLPQGVVDPGQVALIGDSMRIVRDGAESIKARDSILSGREFYDRALEGMNDGPESDLLRKVLGRYTLHSLVPDVDRTSRERESARRGVPQIVARVLEGEAIVRANQQVGPEELEKLDAYRSELRSQGMTVDGSNLQGAAGAIILNTMLFAIFGLLVLLFRPLIYQHFRTLLLVAGILGVYLLAGKIIESQGIPAAALPIVFAAISVAVLWDGRLALLTTFVLAAITVTQEPFASVDVFLLVLIGGAAASFSVRAFRRLAQTWLFIAIIAAAYALAIFGLKLKQEDFPFLMSLLAASASTVIGAILAIGFLPVFEWFTGITSDQTLLGWADTNQTLLRRLAMEAPGTYSHTIQVANLAEAGAGAIGANALLCRVGMYYHDIGKMLKPQYFIENQHGGTNPHDGLDPLTSAAIVREHVVEGIKLARGEKVPAAVVDFIAEHHGDQTIGFFYRQALAAAEEQEEDPPDIARFRYPGPRPRTRETAIAMLADAAESATRALHDPTEARIKELVGSIVASRVESGQLNESPLTLRDLAVLEERFAKILTGTHHQRIDYPDTKHLTDPAPESAAGDAEEPPEDADPDLPEDQATPPVGQGTAQVRSLMWRDGSPVDEGDGS